MLMQSRHNSIDETSQINFDRKKGSVDLNLSVESVVSVKRNNRSVQESNVTYKNSYDRRALMRELEKEINPNSKYYKDRHTPRFQKATCASVQKNLKMQKKLNCEKSEKKEQEKSQKMNNEEHNTSKNSNFKSSSILKNIEPWEKSAKNFI